MQITTIASGSSGNAYVVTDGTTALLLEAGLPVDRIAREVDIDGLDAALISHEHMDHARAAADLARRYCLPMIASPGTLKAARIASDFVAEPISDGEELHVKSMTVKAFAVPHDAAEPLGFLIRSEDGDVLMFVTDAFYIPIKPPKGLTLLMAECNYSTERLDSMIAHGTTPHEQRERIRRSHMSVETLCRWLDENAGRLSGLREIHLMHISSRNGDAEEFRFKVAEITGRPVHIC